MKNTKKKIGIWLDYKEAVIMEAIKNEVNIVTTINSEIEDFHISGGAPAKLKWGLGEIVSDKKFLERRKNQEINYFNRIIKTIIAADEVFIFGPAKAKKGLQNQIAQNKHFKGQVQKVKTADSMTDNQKRAMVRQFYASNELIE